VADNFPEGCDPTASRDSLREALSAHIHRVVSDSYQALASRIESD
jgi:hypothetical protein